MTNGKICDYYSVLSEMLSKAIDVWQECNLLRNRLWDTKFFGDKVPVIFSRVGVDGKNIVDILPENKMFTDADEFLSALMSEPMAKIELIKDCADAVEECNSAFASLLGTFIGIFQKTPRGHTYENEYLEFREYSKTSLADDLMKYPVHQAFSISYSVLDSSYCSFKKACSCFMRCSAPFAKGFPDANFDVSKKIEDLDLENIIYSLAVETAKPAVQFYFAAHNVSSWTAKIIKFYFDNKEAGYVTSEEK